ncbi:MAG: acyl-CoA thioesterase II [Alphaproteobacteria bacterium]|nr:MAG: acyl-CoA thioesterase II [Alphaproteobacteria bacterium]
MTKAVQELLTLLDLESIEVNLFRGRSPKESWQRVFGGQVLGQALVAATRTVEGRSVHSFHAYFIRPGDPKSPILYEVDRARDGRSFTTRRVVAIQHGRTIFTMSASFHIEEEGYSHQCDMPDVPPPEQLIPDHELRKRAAAELPADLASWFASERPIELRPVEPRDWRNPEKTEPFQHVWVRATAPLPDDVALHQCVLAYASDMTLLDTCQRPHGVSVFSGGLQVASLDHAMWFHRSFRADEWLLYVQDSPSSAGARGFNRGTVYRRDGTLVASVAQEGLIRPRKERGVK